MLKRKHEKQEGGNRNHRMLTFFLMVNNHAWCWEFVTEFCKCKLNFVFLKVFNLFNKNTLSANKGRCAWIMIVFSVTEANPAKGKYCKIHVVASQSVRASLILKKKYCIIF